MVVKVFIKEKDGKITQIEMSDAEHEGCTVLQLKRRTRPRDCSQLLLFDGRLLEDAAKLSDYGIKHESTIHSLGKSTKITLLITDLNGKIIDIGLDEDEFKSCLVLDLKRRIRAEEGTPDSSQLLFFNGRLLEDATKLSDYGIKHKSIIRSLVKTTEIIVFVRNEHGETFDISLDKDEFESCLVLDLKRRIRAEEGNPDGSQLLFCNGRLLEDATKLSDYGIKHKSIFRSLGKSTKITLRIANEHGKTFNIGLDEDEYKSCLVLDLKRRIRAEEGTPDGSQLLFCNGRLLEDATKLSDYGIKHKSIFRSLGKSTKITLRIANEHGKTFNIGLDEDEYKSCLVLDLKRRIRAEEGTPDCSQLLFFNGRLLEEATKLSDYRIQHESTIHSLTKITLLIINEHGETFVISLDEDEYKSCLVLDLKRRICAEEGTPDSSQLLFCNGRLLEEATKLSDYGIMQESIHSFTKITLFIRNEHGETFEICLDDDEFESCLVLDLKRRIRAEEGNPDCSQLLFFNGRLLEGATKLWVYGIQQESLIRSYTRIRLFIKALEEETLNISLDEDEYKSCLVLDLKRRICAEEGTPEDQQRLIFAGKQLEDSRSLSDYAIEDSSTIALCIRLRGGGILDPAKGGGGMGDKGGKNRSMDNLLLF